MSLYEFGRLIYRNATYLVVIPLLLAVFVFVFTINQKKEYASSALIYTGIASGFNIESGSSDKIDYHSVNNAFDNLITIVESKQTVKEVLLRMLAHHISMYQNGQPIPQDYSDYLLATFTEEQLKQYTIDLEVDSIYHLLNEAFNQHDRLLNSVIRGDHGLYSTKILSTLEVKRHKSSDMLKLYYTAENPAISKLVLELVIHVFTNRYREIKVAETGDVVAYFQSQLELTQAKLNKAEDKLTDFRTGTRVINYGEQTKAIAIKKENALEEYSNKKMNLLATEVALNEIEDKLKIRQDLLSKNSDLLDKKNKLEELVQKLAKSESSNNSDSIQGQLRLEIEAIKSGIRSDMETVFSYNNSKEGLPNQRLLNEWLDNVITMSREKVNVEYFKVRLKELDDMYDTFAPLGSTLARLEREISVAEREYLEILNGLNMSKLRQQNIQLSSQLEIVDWPQLPLQAMASKRKLLIIVGFLFGLVTVLTILVARELLDNTISTPTKAEKASKLDLIGAFPIQDEKLSKEYPDLVRRLKSIAISKLISDSKHSKLIVVASANTGEGKSLIAEMLLSELRASGFAANLIKPYKAGEEQTEGIQTYEVTSKLNQALLIKDLEINQLEGYTILELPALTQGMIPYELIKSADETILVARADKAWSVAQTKVLKDWKKKVGSKPFLILNGVKTYNLEEFIGSIGTKHNKLVGWFRKLAKFEFGNQAFGAL